MNIERQCASHHGEMLQGMFQFGEAEPIHALVTMPCAIHKSVARILSRPCSGRLTVVPQYKTKSLNAAHAFLRHFGLPDFNGVVEIRTNAPEELGFGSSTMDVVATIYALATYYSIELDAATVAELSVRSEVASDSIMFDTGTVLFAQRAGRVLDSVPAKLTDVIVVGAKLRSSGVATLHLRMPPYSRGDVEQFERLWFILRAGLETSDKKKIGAVCTESALINQRYRPMPKFDQFLSLAESAGALGCQVSHSGSIAGALFNACDAGDLMAEDFLMRLRVSGIDDVWRYEL
ncbi:GHMP kinase [Rhizobium ruizarguesonis]|uniref:GHMP family kinase ATP-binding protein n=1 Tax=Rhizobium ruizarguesonis TaxID=2081791 RepID=UPI00103261E1|nr:GHMP kinase [Rhizobium ruizarguesonis]MBY5856078.1 GHMP kinase [Rhizobium leguminosarum]TBA74482.1 GHMP kinase [Rhizobium ruizarguesonis]